MSDLVIDWTPKARALLGAAGELFYAHGIHAVGVEMIAERAGVTKKTLYDRFGSKERLVVEYLAGRDGEWRGFLGAWLDRAGSDPRPRILGVFEASRAWTAERGGKGCSMINAHAEINEPAHPAYAVILGQKHWMLEVFRSIARSALDERESRVEGIADSLMLLHEGALVTAGMGVVDDPFERAGECAVRLLGL